MYVIITQIKQLVGEYLQMYYFSRVWIGFRGYFSSPELGTAELLQPLRSKG